MNYTYSKDQLIDAFSGDEEILYEIINDFVDCSDEMLNNIKIALDSNDCKEIELTAHTFKGAVSNFYFEDIREVAFFIEECGKDNNLTEAYGLFDKLVEMNDFLKVELKAFNLNYKAA